MLFAACNQFTGNRNDIPPQNTVVVIDTVFASRTDSLEWVLTAGTIAEKMSAYNDLAGHFSETNVSLSRHYAQELLRMSLQAKDKKREGDAYKYLSYVSIGDSSLLYANEAIKIYEAIKDDTLTVLVKLNKAIKLGQLYRNDEALAIMQECLDYYTKNNMAIRRATTLQSIGAMYGDMQLHDISLDYYAQALAVYETLDRDEAVLRGMGFCYSNSGENLSRKKDYQKAYEYSEKALELFREINDDYYTVNELTRLSSRCFIFGNNGDAWRFLNEAKTMVEKIDNNVLHSEVLKTRAMCHALNGDYKQALDDTKQALALMDSTNKRAIFILYGYLAVFAPFAATPLEIQTYVANYTAVAREAINEEWSAKLTEMQTKYETEKKQLEIERQQELIAKQNMQRWLFIAGIAVCVIFLALLWYMLRLRDRRNLALTEMNATKDKFFSIISHDLRNPVVAQRDALQLLVQNSRLWNVDALTAYYGELLKSAEGQVELIYNLLGWAQLQTGRITYNPSTFNLAHRLRSDIALIRDAAEKKGIALAVNIPDDADITGDGAMLSIVVRNLLTNAVKFTVPTGTVTLSVERNVIKGVNELNDPKLSANYTVTISDTGIGMSAEQISKLFRIDSAHSRKGTAGEQGSGLGLIVCRELIEKHGSELHVESEEGKGSRFWFELSSSITDSAC